MPARMRTGSPGAARTSMKFNTTTTASVSSIAPRRRARYGSSVSIPQEGPAPSGGGPGSSISVGKPGPVEAPLGHLADLFPGVRHPPYRVAIRVDADHFCQGHEGQVRGEDPLGL